MVVLSWMRGGGR
uniref:Uncharacterized protein n=1 Tax=Arundo donax TaxID=35708 RepID=A0A0A9FHV8_ARUDO